MDGKHDEMLPAPTSVSFSEALRFWLKLGFISFGGPAGQIAIMHEELVERRRWISERRFLHALNYCMMLPGPEAQQLATYIGWLLHRTWGGILSGALFVLPSLVLLILLSWVYIAFGETPLIAGIFYGIKPAVTAIVLVAGYRIGTRAIANRWLGLLAVSAFTAIFVFSVPFPFIVLTAGLVGMLGGKIAPELFKVGGHHAEAPKPRNPAYIDDDTPALPHTRFRWSRLSAIVAVGILLWLIPMAILFLTCGWGHPLTQMGWFFTKAAFLTFGGAYAVLSYVYQGAVEGYGWVSAEQMIDGLALGETTPGPLIMVVTFVAFVGGYVSTVFGPDLLFVGGAVAACLVTWFTFLPSFIFILLGGPLVESTHGKIGFTAPLTAITAAVVGVIFNLALFFAYHVVWPSGFDDGTDWLAATITVAGILALLRFKMGVVQVIGISAVIGLFTVPLVP